MTSLTNTNLFGNPSWYEYSQAPGTANNPSEEYMSDIPSADALPETATRSSVSSNDSFSSAAPASMSSCPAASSSDSSSRAQSQSSAQPREQATPPTSLSLEEAHATKTQILPDNQKRLQDRVSGSSSANFPVRLRYTLKPEFQNHPSVIEHLETAKACIESCENDSADVLLNKTIASIQFLLDNALQKSSDTFFETFKLSPKIINELGACWITRTIPENERNIERADLFKKALELLNVVLLPREVWRFKVNCQPVPCITGARSQTAGSAKQEYCVQVEQLPIVSYNILERYAVARDFFMHMHQAKLDELNKLPYLENRKFCSEYLEVVRLCVQYCSIRLMVGNKDVAHLRLLDPFEKIFKERSMTTDMVAGLAKNFIAFAKSKIPESYFKNNDDLLQCQTAEHILDRSSSLSGLIRIECVLHFRDKLQKLSNKTAVDNFIKETDNFNFIKVVEKVQLFLTLLSEMTIMKEVEQNLQTEKQQLQELDKRDAEVGEYRDYLPASFFSASEIPASNPQALLLKEQFSNEVGAVMLQSIIEFFDHVYPDERFQKKPDRVKLALAQSYLSMGGPLGT